MPWLGVMKLRSGSRRLIADLHGISQALEKVSGVLNFLKRCVLENNYFSKDVLGSISLINFSIRY